MNKTFITRLAALALAVALTACNLFEEDKKSDPVGVSGTESAWIGKSVDSLRDVNSIAIRDGRLFVANRNKLSPGVAVVDTATGLIVEFYPQLIPPTSLAFTASGHLVATESDYREQGAVSVIDLGTKRIRQSVTPFGTDNGAVSLDGKIYLFDRTSGAVTGFTGNTPGQNIKFDVQTGALSNPYGIAISGGKAYIPRYNFTSLLILNDAGAIGGGTRDSIDLSAYVSKTPIDTPATAPRMAAVVAHDGYIFVALQRLNYKYNALDTSKVLVINAASKTVEKVINLTFRNPGSAVVRGNTWYISGLAGYAMDGGIEKIDLSTRAHAGTLATAATLGGDVGDFAPTGASSGYVVVGSWPAYTVKKIPQ